jgi:MFS family permease
MFKKIIKHISNFYTEYKPLLANNKFISLIFAGIISSFGSKISYFALLRKVYIISGGRVQNLGFLAIFEMLPSILFGAFAGMIIDRLPRKWIMIISDVLSGLTILSVIFINDLRYIYVIAFMSSTVNVFRSPAQSSFEPNLIDKEDIPLLNSFKASTNSLIQVVGSASGAAIVGFVGIRNSFIIDALSFWISAAILVTIIIRELHVKSKEERANTKLFDGFIDGASIMWRNNSIKLMVSIELYLTFAMSMQGTLIYYFIKQTLNMGDKAELAWGTLLSALGIGTMIGSFIIGIKVKKYKNRFKLFLNVLLFDSIAFTLFVVNTYFPLSILLFAFLGVIGAAHVIILNTVLQKTVPDENRGKVFSILGMLNSPISILSILVGTTAAIYISAQNVLLIAAGLEALIAIGIRFTKTFREVDEIISIDAAV